VQPAKHILIGREPHDASRAEPLGLAHLAARINVRPRDPARWGACQRICHYGDDCAEGALVEPMSLFFKKTFLLPADRRGRAEHVDELAGVDLAHVAQIGIAWRADDRDHCGDRLGGHLEDVGSERSIIDRLGLGLDRRRRRAIYSVATLAVDVLHRLTEREAPSVHQQRNPVAALGVAAPTEPSAFGRVDVEPIGPTTSRTRAGKLMRPVSLEPQVEA
jgi:hypothetical protein